MASDTITVFRLYPFEPGQKIHIQEGPRHGDWEVVGVSENKVTLRCPVSLKEFTWDRFCYFTEERSGETWPQRD